MAEFPEKSQYLFDKLLMKLVANKKLTPPVADFAKCEFAKFCETVVLENKEDFVSFNKDLDRLDYFLWKHPDLKMFSKLQQVIKVCLILSHGQAEVERGFSSNKSLIDDNMSSETIIALRSVHDHMKFYNLRAHEVEISKDLMASCRKARRSYYDDQKLKALSNQKVAKEEARSKINEEIAEVNTKIRQTVKEIESLKKSSDEIGFRAEKKTMLG
ncbi:MAG: hypothetical protein AAFY76_21140 [Cyanobacteria bacterium J06649_11]